MNVTIEKSCPPITEAELAAFESELKITLPPDYREFLLKHNGGTPTPAHFDVDIDGFMDTSRVRHFLCLNDTEKYSFKAYVRGYAERIPGNLLPIATELSRNLICISVSGDDYGRVYFWDADWEVTERVPDYENIHHLADTFTVFLNALYEYD